MSSHLTNAARALINAHITEALSAEEANIVLVLDRLREQGVDDGAVLILPKATVPHVTHAFGLPVVLADVPHPMIGLPATRTTP